MKAISRRHFIEGTVAAAAVISWQNPLFAAPEAEGDGPWDMVAVRNGEPVEMFESGIAALGGMKTFVKKGRSVVVKPNIAWDQPPEVPANTNPELVAAIVRHCLVAGASKVTVFDHTCHNWERSYKSSGIAKAVEDAGGVMVSGNFENAYREVELPKAKTLKKALVHKEMLDCDVFINVPVLKHHGGAKLSLCMKNLMGVVWDRGFWHKTDLHQCIADFATYRKPALNVVDAYNVMKRNGPRGVSVEDVTMMKAQIITTDIVAADAAAAKLFGMEPDAVRHIALAADRKVGRKDLENLKIERISI